MTSAVSICSNALVILGAQPISSLDQGNDSARVCRSVYPSVRTAVLRAHSWNCATKRVLLSPESTAPEFDFPYQFLLPSDWLRTLQVGELHCLPRYRTEGRRILTCIPSLPLAYIWRNENEGTWDGSLVDVMELAIAARIAYAITKSGTVRESMRDEYTRALKVAKAIDGQDDPPDEISQAGSIIDARMGYGGPR